MTACTDGITRLLPLAWIAATIAGCSGGDTPDTPPASTAPPARDTVRIENTNFTERPSFFGYVTATTLSVRGAPATGEVVGFVFKGDRVDIYESSEANGGTWHRVSDAAGYVDGWVSGRFVSGRPVAASPPPPGDYGPRITPTASASATARYVGVAACRRCHADPGPGDLAQGEYGVWANHYHAEAYRTLTRPYARALAQQKRGVADPANDWRCVKCHVAALGVPEARRGPNYRDQDGVTCEVCHGPGGDYLLNHWEGQDGYENREANGFVVYRDIEQRDQMCRSCHNPLSPTYKPFNVASFSDAIRHWTNEHVFVEVATADEEAPEPPRPIAQAPPPTADTLDTPPPPVVDLIPDSMATMRVAPPSAPATPAPPPPAAAPTPTPQPEPEPEPEPEPAPAPPAGRDEGPVDMVLDENGERGRVPFPHHEHFDLVMAPSGGETCQTCHHTAEAGDTPEACTSCHLVETTADAPSMEKAGHGTCKNCHREQQAGPKKCSECHIRS